MLPCCPNGCTLAGRNFHIKASRVRTIGSVVRTVDLMLAISIYEAQAFGPWRLTSGLLDFDARLALLMSASGQLQLSSHIFVLKRNPIADRTLSGVRTCCWNVWTDASWSPSKLLDIGEGPDGMFSSSGQMMLGKLSVRTEYHIVRTDALECLNLLEL